MIKKTKSLHMINDIIRRADPVYISSHHVVHLIWSMMSCIHHFQLRFRTGSFALITKTRKKKARECMHSYSQLIRLFPKSTHRVILNALIIFYKEGKLWTIEFRLTELICDLLYLYNDIEEALEDILSTAEQTSLSSNVETRMLIKVLYEILALIKWRHISENMIKRFLFILIKSINPKPDDEFHYGPMRKGLTICIRNITKNLNNEDLMALLVITIRKISLQEMDDETTIQLGSIAEYAALRHKSSSYAHSFPEELIHNIWKMLSSENPIEHLFATRILQNLLDRHNNKAEFERPKIYFKDASYNINIVRYSVRDKIFYKKQRHHIFRVILEGLKNHYTNRINLENIYGLMAITCVEVPCSYVASSLVCLAMSMQEFILNINHKNMEACHHVHAIVMSLMSLVCYIFKAEVFYTYVMQISDTRSELAPHLNPPLKATYKYAQHHILWNKPDLFFEDWEARYGLWKCFRNISQHKKNQTHKLEESSSW
ncbi:protein EFR3 homolog cmp44E-like [Rhynchophorus ferrugineus]|uniref:protein EFR3 homolog cmp44E-like n=1 Tax=Rhynchophorus ferrugineus TaxID=354439 RepID=UPI003FCDFC89